MANFEVPVVRVDRVEHHPDADRLSLVYFRGFCTISAKLTDGSHRYAPGDLVVYVPEGAVVPENLLRMGFWDDAKQKGILAGSNGDRVKALRLRGVVSQGIMFPVERGAVVLADGSAVVVPPEGGCAASALGITKYEPPIPASMSGELASIGTEFGIAFDLENYQRFPDLLVPGEIVTVTEKLHGTQAVLGFDRELDHSDLWGRQMYCGSKSLIQKGLVMRDCEQNRKSNLYFRTFFGEKPDVGELSIAENFRDWCLAHHHERAYLLGEIFGQGVQDLQYGLKKPEFRAFAVVTQRCNDRTWHVHDFADILREIDVQPVPVLYTGPWDPEAVLPHRDGKSVLDPATIREGVVITSHSPGEDSRPTMLKWVSPDYLTRKGGTEFS